MSKNPVPFIIHRPPKDVPVLPVIFDSPHSGKDLTLLWDAHVNRLLDFAPKAGVSVLENLVPRTLIDLNRSLLEIDPADVNGKLTLPHKNTRNVQQKWGLIPSMIRNLEGVLVPAFTEATKPTQAEIERRIELYYKPYHKALTDLLDEAYEKHGIAIHFNFHSIPRLPAPDNYDLIIGDLNGQSAAPQLVKFVDQNFRKEGLSVGTVYAFRGGELLRKTHSPAKGRHSLQIEIARDLYMDQDTLEFDEIRGKKMSLKLLRMITCLNEFIASQAAFLNPGPGFKSVNSPMTPSSPRLSGEITIGG